MSKRLFTFLMLPLILLFCNSSQNSVARSKQKSSESQTGTLEKMTVADGSVSMDIDLNRLNGISSATQKLETLRFVVKPNSFFTILVFNDLLRAAESGSMGLIPQNTADLPASLNASLNQLAIEKMDWGAPFDIVVRDGKPGSSFSILKETSTITMPTRSCLPSPGEDSSFHKSLPTPLGGYQTPVQSLEKSPWEQRCNRSRSHSWQMANPNRR
jgi:hypothetical protein